MKKAAKLLLASFVVLSTGQFQNNAEADGFAIPYAGVTLTHDIAVGPFLSLPLSPKPYIQYAIKAKVQNLGTSNETNVPIKFFVNSIQVNSTTINLNAGAADSVSFNWTPPNFGNFTLAIVSALANDENRYNDTVKTTLYVLEYGCAGGGNTIVGYPFYTFYMDSRTDMLYLASELGYAQWIHRIWFNVAAAAPQLMNGFKIKMQHTSLNSITTFTDTGWTVVYDGVYSVPGTGWRYINLQGSGFLYNGTSNLLIEICFNNTTYTTNSTVYATPSSGRVVHNHADNILDGCVYLTTPGSGYTALPNMCVNVVGVNKQNSEVPELFSLSQNYPNPFNPSTIINYTLPEQSMVKLAVYDILGKEVRILVNETKPPGSYDVEFDASSLASGVYIYKIHAGNPVSSTGQVFTDTKKMLLVK